MLNAAPPGLQLPALRLVKLGGEAVTRRDTELFDAHCPADCVLRVGLGSTEAYLMTAYLYRRGQSFAGNITPVGQPGPGVEVWLETEAGERLDPDVTGRVGQVIVRSPFLSPGYWGQPDETVARFRPDPDGGDRRVLATGDLGYWLPDGNLQHLGRRDERVKVRGHWVDLSAVEAALLDLAQVCGVREAAATVQTEANGETRLVAYYTTAQGVAESALRAALAERLPADMWPDDFMRLDTLPLLPFGKVDRRALPPVTPADRVRPSAAPRTATELKLAALWSQVLRRGEVGVLDNFFDLGGDSLVAVQLQQQIEASFGARLEMRDLFEAPSLDQMARLIEARLIESRAAGPLPRPGAPDEMTPEALALALRRLGV
jgi:acyl-coenzyme A synthetase/AMP-(fatty) acid ligase/acyl carrier protein